MKMMKIWYAMVVATLTACGGGGGGGGGGAGGDAVAAPTVAEVAPAILSHPESQQVQAGDAFTFTVSATGSAPLSYQWLRNGQEVAGATGKVYSRASDAIRSRDDNSRYSVRVTNRVSSVVSREATLTVVDRPPPQTAPSISNPPSSKTVVAGESVTLVVGANGSAPLSYQWKRNGVNIVGAPNSSSYTFVVQSGDDGAVYSVEVSNSVNRITSGGATLTVLVPPTITTQPNSLEVTAGEQAVFSVVATGKGSTALNYQWYKGSNSIQNGPNAQLSLTAQAADTGAKYSVVVSNGVSPAAVSAMATLVVHTRVQITTQPAPQTVTAGSTATFQVMASGTGNLTYQWKKGGTPIAGANAASFTTPSTALANNGDSYTVEIVQTNSRGVEIGRVTSNAATLTVNAAPVAPSITSHPVSQTIQAGQVATFRVTATGTAPLTYEWFRNGTKISGASNSDTYALTTQTADNGARFSVRVSNSQNQAVTSNEAVLTVTAVPGASSAVPVITTHPKGVAVNAGVAATFTVQTQGASSYQWLKNGAIIPSANGATYSTPLATAGDSGTEYRVRVYNARGYIVSKPARLWVNQGTVDVPQILEQPASTAVTAGEIASFSFRASGLGPYTFEWLRDGVALTTPSSPNTYRTQATSLAADDGAQYVVKISKGSTVVYSDTAVLTVRPDSRITPPVFSKTPSQQTVSAGDIVSLESVAQGAGTVTYQWLRDGFPIDDANLLNYHFFANSGAQYSVVATNNGGSTVSTVATVSVTPSPEPAADVYVAGNTGQTAWVRKNGVRSELPSIAFEGSAPPSGVPTRTWIPGASDLIVDAGTIHVTGHMVYANDAGRWCCIGPKNTIEANVNDNFRAAYWVNTGSGFSGRLLEPKGTPVWRSGDQKGPEEVSSTSSINVISGKVVVTGFKYTSGVFGRPQATTWLDGVPGPHFLGSYTEIAYASAKFGNEVFTTYGVGHPYSPYQGGLQAMVSAPHKAAVPNADSVTALFATADRMYLAGNIKRRPVPANLQEHWSGQAAYWTMSSSEAFSSPVDLISENESYPAQTNIYPKDIVTVGDAVYVVGVRGDKPTVWKNGRASITLPGGGGEALRIRFRGTHSYIVGRVNSRPALWIDGVLNYLDSDGGATGLVVQLK